MTLEEQLTPIIASINTNKELTSEQATQVYVPMILAIVRERIVDAAQDAWTQALHAVMEPVDGEEYDRLVAISRTTKAKHFEELSKTL